MNNNHADKNRLNDGNKFIHRNTSLSLKFYGQQTKWLV